jgi:hypothetical protein
MGPCIVLKDEVMTANEWHDNGPQDLVMVSLHSNCHQKMQLCLLSVAYACPYHNPTMVHSAYYIDISKPLAHMTPYIWSADEKPVGRTGKFSKPTLEVALVEKLTLNNGGHSCSQHTNCTFP